jgi:hypothetical protein
MVAMAAAARMLAEAGTGTGGEAGALALVASVVTAAMPMLVQVQELAAVGMAARLTAGVVAPGRAAAA